MWPRYSPAPRNDGPFRRGYFCRSDKKKGRSSIRRNRIELRLTFLFSFLFRLSKVSALGKSSPCQGARLQSLVARTRLASVRAAPRGAPHVPAAPVSRSRDRRRTGFVPSLGAGLRGPRQGRRRSNPPTTRRQQRKPAPRGRSAGTRGAWSGAGHAAQGCHRSSPQPGSSAAHWPGGAA
jgi:hypothetical protein